MTIWKGPEIVAELTVTETGAGLANVNVCGALKASTWMLPKEWLAGATVGGGGAMPVPVRVTDRGVPGALSQMEKVSLVGPRTLGENVTLIEHELPGAYGVAVLQLLAQMKAPLEQIGPP